MRALILADDSPQRSRWASALREAGLATDLYASSQMPSGYSCQVVLLEKSAASISVSTLRALLRESVLIVIGEADPGARVLALNDGADAYLAHDCSSSMLVAQVFALLRLRTSDFREHYHLGDLRLDVVHRRVTLATHHLPLSPIEFALLRLLVQHAGKTLPRSFIIEQLWGPDSTCVDNSLEVHIHRLRSKLNGSLLTPSIHTVRRTGYRLDPPPEC